MTGVQLVPEFDRLDTGERERLLRDVRSRIAVRSRSTEVSQYGAVMVLPEQLPVEIRTKMQQMREAGFAVPEMFIGSRHGGGETIQSAEPTLRDALEQEVAQRREAVDKAMLFLIPALIFAVITTAAVAAADAPIYVRALAALPVWSVVAILTFVAARRASRLAPVLHKRRNAVLSDYERSVIRTSAIAVPGDCPELRLGSLAQRQATRIAESDAWRNAILDEHRLQFAPEAEARQITVHAARIAAMRTQIGHAPAGNGDVLDQARSAVANEHAALDVILESLVKRVAALMAYADRVAELSAQLRALRAIERAAGLSGQVDALAAQVGADELAAVKLHRLSTDADAIAAKVNAIAAELSRVLVPQPPR